jgi:hypothetical protein
VLFPTKTQLILSVSPFSSIVMGTYNFSEEHCIGLCRPSNSEKSFQLRQSQKNILKLYAHTYVETYAPFLSIEAQQENELVTTPQIWKQMQAFKGEHTILHYLQLSK